MPKIILTLLALSASGLPVLAIEPIEGSLTYKGHVSHLEKSPVGGVVKHRFVSGSNTYEETYVVAPDRTLKLQRRDRLGNR